MCQTAFGGGVSGKKPSLGRDFKNYYKYLQSTTRKRYNVSTFAALVYTHSLVMTRVCRSAEKLLVGSVSAQRSAGNVFHFDLGFIVLHSSVVKSETPVLFFCFDFYSTQVSFYSTFIPHCCKTIEVCAVHQKSSITAV